MYERQLQAMLPGLGPSLDKPFASLTDSRFLETILIDTIDSKLPDPEILVQVDASKLQVFAAFLVTNLTRLKPTQTTPSSLLFNNHTLEFVRLHRPTRRVD